MARRKSLLAQMYAARQKAQLERQRAAERERKEFAAEERRLAAQLEKEAQQAQRARQQAERLAAQQEKERQRQAAAQVREQQRQQAEAQREEQRQAIEERRLAVQRRMAEAEFRTDAVHRQVVAFERLLQDRNRVLASQSRRVEEAFNTHGSEAFVAASQQALATSAYPDGYAGRARRCTGPRPASC